MNSDKIVILGAGLAGLLSHYRLKDSYQHLATFDQMDRIPLRKEHNPAFYIHEFLDDYITDKKITVEWKIISESDSYTEQKRLYKQKIYGDNFNGKVSIVEKSVLGYQLNVVNLLSQIDNVYLNNKIENIDIKEHRIEFSNSGTVGYDILINTIPMPVFLELAGLEIPPFRTETIYVETEQPAEINQSKMIIEYHPDPEDIIYRRTIWSEWDTKESLQPIGTPLPIGKIHPSPVSEFIVEDLKHQDIHMIGRFARWEPKYLVHETYKLIKDELNGTI